MVVEKVVIENETEARILISSSKNLTTNIIKRIQEMKKKENFEELSKEMKKENENLDEEEKSIIGFEVKLKDLKENKKKNKENKESIKKKKLKFEKESEKLEEKTKEIEQDIIKFEDQFQKLKVENEKKEKDYEDFCEKMKNLKKEKKELDDKIKDQKDMVGDLVRKEFYVQKEIETNKMKFKQYEDQNIKKVDENKVLEGEVLILIKKTEILINRQSQIKEEKTKLTKLVETKKAEMTDIFKQHQIALEEIIDCELMVKKFEIEQDILKTNLTVKINEKEKVDTKIENLTLENSKTKNEINKKITDLEELQQEVLLLKKTNSKVEDVIKEVIGVLSKSKKLLKRFNRIFEYEDDDSEQASPNLDNYLTYQNPRKSKHKVSKDRRQSLINFSDKKSKSIIDEKIFQSNLLNQKSIKNDKASKFTDQEKLNSNNRHLDMDENIKDIGQLSIRDKQIKKFSINSKRSIKYNSKRKEVEPLRKKNTYFGKTISWTNSQNKYQARN